MGLGICGICTENQAKYKCPKCIVEYCSLACFKSEKHSHDEVNKNIETIEVKPTNKHKKESINPAPPSQSLFEKIAQDSVVQSLLQYKSLQIHLSILLKLLLDSQLTREPIYENRKEIVNMRLCDLRIGGPEENELVEEFVQRVLFLHEKEQH